MYFDIHILAVASDPHSQGSGKGHDLVGAEAPCICHIDSGPADYFLKKTHDIQMADKAHGTIFFKFYAQSQHKFLLQIGRRRSPGILLYNFQIFPPDVPSPTHALEIPL